MMKNNSKLKIIGCIPARYASTRLPGKPLCIIAGKAMILHVVEKAKQCQYLSDVVVLTDDQRIYKVVANAGFNVAMTSETCLCGSDRIAEYMQQSDADIFVNIQGDEITLNPKDIDLLIRDFTQQKSPEMGTLAHWCSDENRLASPSNVKVVTRCDNQALYFSRSPIPIQQNGDFSENSKIHIGLYIYTRKILEKLITIPPSPLEKVEKLEQLRALENNISITVSTINNYQGLAVDTADDLKKAREIFAKPKLN
jgi:3-deoxy-manno-octulosonate cytidylyltransferase (CMP-KDO synthetase)